MSKNKAAGLELSPAVIAIVVIVVVLVIGAVAWKTFAPTQQMVKRPIK